MFDYIDLSEDKITTLENSDLGTIILSGLMITHGVRQGVFTADQMMTAIHNTFLAALNVAIDEGFAAEPSA